jgi:hypothetical protein
MSELSSHIEQQPVPKRWRGATAGLALSLTIAGTSASSIATATPASAESVRHVEGTNGLGLALRDQPSTSGAKLATIPEGGEFDAHCWREGENIGDNPKWEEGTYQGQIGNVSDYYLDTGVFPSDDELEAEGIPKCDSPLQQKPELLGAYRREVAVAYAEAHAEDMPPYPASCTQLVSRALWASGVRQSYDWNDGEFQEQHFDVGGRPGTVPAWRASALFDYLKGAFPRSTERELNLNHNAVPDAEPGDIFAYDWDGDDKIDHLAIEVDKTSTDYPLLAEWSIYGGTQQTPYKKRGWTYSEKTHNWLQASYPNVKVHLLHLDPRFEPAPDEVNPIS